ncbi:MAG: DUF1987 domain-containing protein [Bacteroidia bacterium]|nr:DUF1987 domain-containing protein [Bacteroidia bacterium]
MENLFIARTDETPEINFNVNGDLLVKGVSIPENILKFYKPVMDWIERFEKHSVEFVKMTFEIEYANTSSSRVFIDLIRRVDGLKKNGVNSTIIWRYAEGDDDNYDLGKDMEYVTKALIVFSAI